MSFSNVKNVKESDNGWPTRVIFFVIFLHLFLYSEGNARKLIQKEDMLALLY